MNTNGERLAFLKAIARKAARWVGRLVRRIKGFVTDVLATHSRRMHTEVSYVTSVLGFIINVAYVVIGNRLVRSRLEILARSLFAVPQRGPAELAY